MAVCGRLVSTDLGADYAVGTGWSSNREIVHFWPEDKASWLASLLTELHFQRDGLVAVGDCADVAVRKPQLFRWQRLPEGLQNVRHWPDADISAIVEDILR